MKFVACLALLAVPACAPAPLYVGERARFSTGGDVPRDALGNPVLGAIQPPPELPKPPTRPL